jgi:hypothetical protein
MPPLAGAQRVLDWGQGDDSSVEPAITFKYALLRFSVLTRDAIRPAGVFIVNGHREPRRLVRAAQLR